MHSMHAARSFCRKPRAFLVPEEYLVGARVNERLSVTDLDDRGGQLLNEIAVVRHDDERAALVHECVE